SHRKRAADALSVDIRGGDSDRPAAVGGGRAAEAAIAGVEVHPARQCAAGEGEPEADVVGEVAGSTEVPGLAGGCRLRGDRTHGGRPAVAADRRGGRAVGALREHRATVAGGVVVVHRTRVGHAVVGILRGLRVEPVVAVVAGDRLGVYDLPGTVGGVGGVHGLVAVDVVLVGVPFRGRAA